MSWLRFLVKFSFICNCCYLLGFVIRMTDYQDNFEGIVKHILVLGYLVSPFLNIITILLAVILLLAKRTTWANVHPYIFILNVIIFLIQLELFI
ncbi:hypothetical protein [Chitinophaga sp. XS-30]|uniref:hypothetical protein n=1 Tax=Chitinophaga sp. XS-30 TaxID=2604421 RepID=UPI0011DD372F|nr:hypothetical protein [Chitinophaga sp. XS-30]QEH42104.1 hypothetical protein FW415_14965 [Chitinophaga sp. XS-30]